MGQEHNGTFITFEGIDGCGKSTQLELFSLYLSERGIRYELIREPGGTVIGEKIREILLDKMNTGMSAETELLLFEASRSQIVREIILPALREGAVVICDRFSDSTTAYQGYGRGIDIGSVKALNDYATSGLKPDITFLFDISAEAASRRMGIRERESDRLDSESREFAGRVRNGYIKLAEEEPERVRMIDASEDADIISVEVIRIFEEVYKNETSLCDR